MECPNLAKTEAPEPQLSLAAFSQRCKRLAVEFGGAIGLPTGDLAFAPEINSTTATMTLGGRASEMITRNRGRSHRVVPLTALSDDVFIWTGYREAWQKQGSEQNLRFVEGGFTLHLGRQGEVTKPQILRSEWVGRRSRAFVDMAGHPHWQLDVLESARSTVPNVPARFGDLDAPRPVVDFNSAAISADGPDFLLGLTVENMHLASAALWWRPPGANVAHLPETVAELDRWILGCVAYLRQEAARCRVVPSTVRA